MGTSTSTGTLTAGQSRTFNLAPASAVTLTLLPNVRVTITESPAAVAATGLGGNATRVHEPRLPGTFTYGPYPMGGSVVVDVDSNSGSSVSWVETSSIYSKDSSGNVTGLVGPGGEDVHFAFSSPTLDKIGEVDVCVFAQGPDGRYVCTDGLNATGGEQQRQLFVVTGDPFGTTYTRSFLTKTLYTEVRSAGGVTPSAGLGICDAWWLSTGEILFVAVLTISGTAGRTNLYRAKESAPGSGVWTVGANANCDDRLPVIELGDVAGTQTPYIRTLHSRSLVEATVGGAKHIIIGEYNVAASRTGGGANDQVRYYKSTDGGRTFAILITFNQGGSHQVDHAHSVVQDPASGRIFFLLGDNEDSAILSWDGTSAAPAANTAPSAYASTSGWDYYGTGQSCTTGDLLFDAVGGHYLPDVDLPTTIAAGGLQAMSLDCMSTRIFAGIPISRTDNRAPLIGVRSVTTGAFYFFSLIADTGADGYFYVWGSADGKSWSSIGLISQKQISAGGGIINNAFFDSSDRLIISGVRGIKGTQLTGTVNNAAIKGSSLLFSENFVSKPSATDVLS